MITKQDKFIEVFDDTTRNFHIVAYCEWGEGAQDVGINIYQNGKVVSSFSFTVDEALNLAEQLELAAVQAKYLERGYNFSTDKMR